MRRALQSSKTEQPKKHKKWDDDNILDYEDFVVFFKDIEVGKVNKDGSIKPVYN